MEVKNAHYFEGCFVEVHERRCGEISGINLFGPDFQCNNHGSLALYLLFFVHFRLDTGQGPFLRVLKNHVL